MSGGGIMCSVGVRAGCHSVVYTPQCRLDALFVWTMNLEALVVMWFVYDVRFGTQWKYCSTRTCTCIIIMYFFLCGTGGCVCVCLCVRVCVCVCMREYVYVCVCVCVCVWDVLSVSGWYLLMRILRLFSAVKVW